MSTPEKQSGCCEKVAKLAHDFEHELSRLAKEPCPSCHTEKQSGCCGWCVPKDDRYACDNPACECHRAAGRKQLERLIKWCESAPEKQSGCCEKCDVSKKSERFGGCDNYACECHLKNGLVGELAGYRIHGKSYDADGNEIKEAHPSDCFCCRKNLLAPEKQNVSESDFRDTPHYKYMEQKNKPAREKQNVAEQPIFARPPTPKTPEEKEEFLEVAARAGEVFKRIEGKQNVAAEQERANRTVNEQFDQATLMSRKGWTPEQNVAGWEERFYENFCTETYGPLKNGAYSSVIVHFIRTELDAAKREVVEELKQKLLENPRSDVEGNKVWNAVTNQLLKLLD